MLTILPLVLPLAVAILSPTDPPPTHPHYPMQTRIAAANGVIKVNWFTLPFNENPRRDIKPAEVKAGYLWSRGFSLETDIDLLAGKTRIPKGRYMLGFLKGVEDWAVVLQTREYQRLRFQLRRARRQGGDTAALQKQLEAAAKQNLQLPSRAFEGKHAEHMELVVLNRGFRVKSRRDRAAAAGMRAELRFSLGNIHVAVELQEAFAAEKKVPK